MCRKGLTWKYYAKKILYFLRQQNILKNLKEYLQRPTDQQSFLEGKSLAEILCRPPNDSFPSLLFYLESAFLACVSASPWATTRNYVWIVDVPEILKTLQ